MAKCKALTRSTVKGLMCSTMTVSLLTHNKRSDVKYNGKQRLKRCVLRRVRKIGGDGADVKY